MNKVRYKGKAYFCLIVVSLAYLWANFHRQSMAVMAPFLMESLNISTSQVGNLGSIIFYIYGLTQIPFGYFSRKYGGTRVIQFSLICLVIGSFIFGQSNTYRELLIGRLIIGFAVSGFYVPSINLIRQWFDIREFGFYMGLFLSIGNIGALLSTTPYEILLSNYSLPYIYNILSIIALVLVVASFFLYEDKSILKKIKIEDSEEKLPFGFMNFYIMLSLYGLAFYGSRQAFISLWGFSYYTSALGYDLRTGSFLMMLISIGGIVFTPLAGKIADKIGRFNALVKQSIVTAILWIILAIIPKDTPFPIMVFLAFWIGALKISTVANAFTALTDYATNKTRSLLVALLNTTNFFGSAILMQAMGFLFEGRDIDLDIFRRIFIVFGVLIFITIIGLNISKKKMDKNLPNC